MPALADSSYPLLNVFWTMFEFFLWIIWIWILIWIFIDIFRSHDLSGWAKALWFLFVLFIPLIGVLVYLIARGSSMQERAQQDARKQDQEFRSYVQQAASSSPASTADQLAKLADLRDRGVISAEEFEPGGWQPGSRLIRSAARRYGVTVRVEASREAAGFVNAHGGRLWVWAAHPRMCCATSAYMHAATEAPPGLPGFTRVPAAGLGLWFRAPRQDPARRAGDRAAGQAPAARRGVLGRLPVRARGLTCDRNSGAQAPAFRPGLAARRPLLSDVLLDDRQRRATARGGEVGGESQMLAVGADPVPLPDLARGHAFEGVHQRTRWAPSAGTRPAGARDRRARCLPRGLRRSRRKRS